MKLYGGVDLHSNNAVFALKDEQGKRVFCKRLPNDLPSVLNALEPFREQVEAIAVESTYNWYWLVDGLMEAGFNVRLANPAAVDQYEGINNVRLPGNWDDRSVGKLSPNSKPFRSFSVKMSCCCSP